MTEVPELIKDLFLWSGARIDDVDVFLFHQPNRFMLQKLADKLNIPHNKMPNNVVEKFGNSSGVTIPLAATYNLSNKLLYEKQRICFSGFGVGLTWGAMLTNLGPLQFCQMIEY
jgi:3-oxoacyl-[acyl-carrier-protein] synthase-3